MNYLCLSLLLVLPLVVSAVDTSGDRRRVHWTLDRERSQLWLAHQGALEVYDTTGERLARLVTPDLRFVHRLDYDARLDQVRVATDAAVLRFALLAQFESDGDASRVIRRLNPNQLSSSAALSRP